MLVSNTILLAKLKHKEKISAISKKMENNLMGEFKVFVWKGKEKKVRDR